MTLKKEQKNNKLVIHFFLRHCNQHEWSIIIRINYLQDFIA